MERRKLFRWAMIIFNAIMISFAVHLVSNFNLYKGKIAEVRKTYITHDILGWRYCIKWPDNEFNNNGFRGRKYEYEKDDFVIILLGDSQVESLCTDFEHIAEKCLEKSIDKKNVKVFSVGAGGYGSDQELIALQEYFGKGFRANLVLLWFTPGNDPWNNGFSTHYNETKPTFIMNNGIVSNKPKYYSDEKDYNEKYLPTPYAGGKFDPGKKYVQIIPRVGRFDNYTTEKTHSQIALSPVSERGKYLFALTNALIKRTEALCYRNMSQFFTFYISLPNNEKQFFDPQFIFKEDGEYFDTNSGKSFVISTDTYNDNIKTCLSGIDYVEIKLTGNNIHPENDQHLNNEGNDEAMRTLARILKEKNLIPEK